MFYLRAPEVTLGIDFNESIDVWGVGCTLAFLYLGQNLFPVKCIFQMVGPTQTNVDNVQSNVQMSADHCAFSLQMKRLVEILGFPQEYLLQSGRYTRCFFTEAPDYWIPWRLLVELPCSSLTSDLN